MEKFILVFSCNFLKQNFSQEIIIFQKKVRHLKVNFFNEDGKNFC